MKEKSKSFKIVFANLIAFIVIMILLIISIFYLPINSDYQISIAMVLIVILMIGVMKFKPRIMYYLENLLFHRLKSQQGPEIKSNISPESNAFYGKLMNDNFETYYKSNDFTLHYKYVKDKKNWILKRPMLIVFVILHQPYIDFQDKQVVNEINNLENKLYKMKKRIVNYSIFILKSSSKLTNKDKESCDYVSFTKVGKRSIVNINAIYNITKKSYYFLYSDTYTPNTYYNYAVDFLKSII